jgi:hypothetical protein
MIWIVNLSHHSAERLETFWNLGTSLNFYDTYTLHLFLYRNSGNYSVIFSIVRCTSWLLPQAYC